ncbi:MAG: phosphopyruvate hydratase [Armatimonadetes bacterium]|nr:phosphopyruvate hydratase [Armatimonadota bacterium]MDW8120706.1 phosphopyruvate hydratase [Armatimonadota bacterium]
MAVIRTIGAREVLDSRGYPTVEAEVMLSTGARGVASVPAGASVGSREAVEKRDGDRSRWEGKGVLSAVKTVKEVIAPALIGKEADPEEVDALLRELDGTPDKSRLGANTLLAVSLATARAAAEDRGLPLTLLINQLSGSPDMSIPTPMVNIISGGHHAAWTLDFQDYLVIPAGAFSFRQALDWTGLIYHHLKNRLKKEGFSTLLADEGGFAVPFPTNEKPLHLLTEVISEVGLNPRFQVWLAIDVAATHFYSGGRYQTRTENRSLSTLEMVETLSQWSYRYPIISIEDGVAENDEPGWENLTLRLGGRVQLVGDDLLVTNAQRIKECAQKGIANAALIKPNQVGTLTEALNAIRACREVGYNIIISARSGETEDPFIADLAVGVGAGQIKVGSIARGERTSKYNQLLRLEEMLGSKAPFAGAKPFERFGAVSMPKEEG